MFINLGLEGSSLCTLQNQPTVPAKQKQGLQAGLRVDGLGDRDSRSRVAWVKGLECTEARKFELSFLQVSVSRVAGSLTSRSPTDSQRSTPRG